MERWTNGEVGSPNLSKEKISKIRINEDVPEDSYKVSLSTDEPLAAVGFLFAFRCQTSN